MFNANAGACPGTRRNFVGASRVQVRNFGIGYSSRARCQPHPIDPQALSMELFQVPDYIHWKVVGGTWYVFSTWEFPVAPSFEPQDPQLVQLYHGTTLGQVGSIFREGFLVRKQEALKHPSGLYGSDHPGHSFDRCKLNRGYSYQLRQGLENRPGPLGGWDEPTAL